MNPPKTPQMRRVTPFFIFGVLGVAISLSLQVWTHFHQKFEDQKQAAQAEKPKPAF